MSSYVKNKKTELNVDYTFNPIDNFNTIVTTNSSYSGDSFTIKDLVQERQDEIIKHLILLEERLFILQDNIEKHKKYPTLKDLYDQYKMTEALIGKDIKNENNKKNKN